MTAPISLIPYEDCDPNEVLIAVQESVVDVSPWMPWCHANYSYEEALAHAQVTKECRSLNKVYEFAILDSMGRFAGSCGINRIYWSEGVANLGYWVRSSMTGRGIASAAVMSLSAWAFEKTALNRLEIVASIANMPSCRVAERAEASRDALLRKRILVDGVAGDAILYSIVRAS